MPKGIRNTVNGLNEKQEKFCLEFVKDGDGARAYWAAGYKAKNKVVAQTQSCRRLKMPAVIARIQALRDKEASKAIADGRELKERLTEIIRQHASEEVLCNVGIGDGCSKIERHVKKGDLRCVLKAIELLGKMGGHFTENVNLMGGVRVVIKDDLED